MNRRSSYNGSRMKKSLANMPIWPALIVIMTVFTLGAWAAATQQDTLIKKLENLGGVWYLHADFVELLYTDSDQEKFKRYGMNIEDYPGGLAIRNINPRIRVFRITPDTHIALLRNAGEYFKATPQQLLDGLKGRNYGWKFDWSTPFTLKLDGTRLLEIRQVYTP